MNKLEQRIVDISKRKGLSHIGSCLSVLPILVDIYEKKHPRDKVILDNAHAHVAHLVVKEEYEKLENIEDIIDSIGIHCDKQAGCDASGGSLGHGLGVAIGLAMINRDRTINVILSEGSLMEGSTWEGLRNKEDFKLDNIQIYLNLNGYSAVAKIDRERLINRVRSFCPYVHVWRTENGEGFSGLQGHYKIL